jgi:hypothetical protein
MGRRTASYPPATREVVNAYSAGGSSSANLASGAIGRKVASGAGTANVLATVLTVTGGGWVPYLICYSNSATPSHTIRCQVIVDGVAAFDATSDTIGTVINRGITVVDCVPSGTEYGPSGTEIRFNSSLEVKVASSQSGTDYVAINYELHRT